MSRTDVDADQCIAITDAGKQCSRPAGSDGFCYQHDEGDKTVSEANADDAESTDDRHEDTNENEAPSDADGAETIGRTSTAALEVDWETNDRADQSSTMAETESDIADSDIGQVREQVLQVASDVVGHPLDGITSVDNTDDGWRVSVEVIERKGVPDTQDILGRYEIFLDDDMEVTSYQRTHRFRRDDMNHDI